MRKACIFLAVILLLAGCAGSGSHDVIEIGDRFFVTQTTDIHINADEYIGQTFRYEGIFQTFHWPATGEAYHQVIRNTFGCCGDDGIIGFLVYLGDIEPFPRDAWVEVVGVLEWFEVSGFRIPRMAAVSVTEMAKRGQEFVTN